ncbi:hypothetical protein DIS24_g11785 [Lasiodiplodia hormozganensis]|uniref:Uncharacterized protein n=1 Tax=Lasiodiplodia hormozganensis TaxID=869390 RepID=A0AA40BVW9_9PEZI|nr:hypothetical protein DIS24_g11785 [Lasiodiplodia hormozganensis]
MTALFRPLWALLPCADAITLGFRAVAGPARVWSNTVDRRTLNVLEVALVKSAARLSGWNAVAVARIRERFELLPFAAEGEDVPSRKLVPDVVLEQAMAQAGIQMRECAEGYEGIFVSSFTPKRTNLL